jgi:hypothetical protein
MRAFVSLLIATSSSSSPPSLSHMDIHDIQQSALDVFCISLLSSLLMASFSVYLHFDAHAEHDSLLVALILTGLHTLHAIWCLAYYPQFHTQTEHVTRVLQSHPYAHPDYLHPEQPHAYMRSIERLRMRQLVAGALEWRSDGVLQATAPVSSAGLTRDSSSSSSSNSNNSRESHNATPSTSNSLPPSSVPGGPDVQLFGSGDHRQDTDATPMQRLFATDHDIAYMDTTAICCVPCLAQRVRSVTMHEEAMWLHWYPRVQVACLLVFVAVDYVFAWHTWTTCIPMACIGLCHIMLLQTLSHWVTETEFSADDHSGTVHFIHVTFIIAAVMMIRIWRQPSYVFACELAAALYVARNRHGYRVAYIFMLAVLLLLACLPHYVYL